jgi:endonuclease-3
MDKDNRERVLRIIEILGIEYPDARTALHFRNPLELLVATVLSAQCTDQRVNQVTEGLFEKYQSARDYGEADLDELEEDIRPTGFFRNKAKAIKSLSVELVSRFNGQVPASQGDLVSLPGIGRKTANLILGEAFGIPGIVVDTHVKRLATLIGLTHKSDPEKIEFDLMEVVPEAQWTLFSNLLILHGRAICVARKPKHDQCRIVGLCDEGIRWKQEKSRTP